MFLCWDVLVVGSLYLTMEPVVAVEGMNIHFDSEFVVAVAVVVVPGVVDIVVVDKAAVVAVAAETKG